MFMGFKSVISGSFALIFFYVFAVPVYGATSKPNWCSGVLLRDRTPLIRAQLDANIAELRAEAGPDHELKGFWGPGSLMWKIAANPLLPIMGTKTLYLQLAQPAAAQGVADHSERLANHFVERFQSTFNYLWRLIYGGSREAEGIAKGLFNRHTKITGMIPVTAGAYQAGETYSANDPEAALWVAETFLLAMKESYELGAGPLSRQELDQLAYEGRRFAMLFGVPSERIPHTWMELQQYYDDVTRSGELEFTPDARKIESHHRSIVLEPGISQLGRRLAVDYVDALTAEMLPRSVADDLGLNRGLRSKLTFASTKIALRRLYKLLPEWARKHPMARMAEARAAGLTPNPRDEVAYKLMVGQLPIELRTLLSLSWPDVFSLRELPVEENHGSSAKPSWSGASRR